MQTTQIEKTTYTISDFISWAEQKRLVLSPFYQRRSVWKSPAKSFLMDTVAKGLPLPLIFLRAGENRDGEDFREVVDGQQRLRTILGFINPDLIENYDPKLDAFTVMESHNPDLANRSYSDLNKSEKQAIRRYSISVHVLPIDTADREVLEIFARINATGTSLNAQELRNANFHGEFKQLAYSLGFEYFDKWQDWGVFNPADIARMSEVQMTSELMILMINGVTGGSKSQIDGTYLRNDEKFPNKQIVKSRFEKIFGEIDSILGSNIEGTYFARPPGFYALFAWFYDIAWGLGSEIDDTQGNVIPRSIIRKFNQFEVELARGKAPDDVIESFSRRTTNPAERKRRIKYLTDSK